MGRRGASWRIKVLFQLRFRPRSVFALCSARRRPDTSALLLPEHTIFSAARIRHTTQSMLAFFSQPLSNRGRLSGCVVRQAVCSDLHCLDHASAYVSATAAKCASQRSAARSAYAAASLARRRLAWISVCSWPHSDITERQIHCLSAGTRHSTRYIQQYSFSRSRVPDGAQASQFGGPAGLR